MFTTISIFSRSLSLSIYAWLLHNNMEKEHVNPADCVVKQIWDINTSCTMKNWCTLLLLMPLPTYVSIAWQDTVEIWES